VKKKKDFRVTVQRKVTGYVVVDAVDAEAARKKVDDGYFDDVFGEDGDDWVVTAVEEA
jgi:hypothetical protein